MMGGPSPFPELQLRLLDELPVGVWVAAVPSGQLVYANHAFSAILGVPARSDVGTGEYTGAYVLIDRSGRPFLETDLPFYQAIQQRRTVVVEGIVAVRPDGTRIHIRASGKPVFDADETLTHVVVAFTDVTAQVEAERESAVARERLHVAVHHAPIVLFTTDEEGIITLSEGAALPALGLRSGETLGKSAFALYAGNPEVQGNLRRALSGETFTTVTELGSTTLETWMSPLRGPDGRVTGLIGVSTDITERLRLERQMAHTDRISALGRLAASVAHEINNPLTYTLESLRLAREAADELVGALGARDRGAVTARGAPDPASLSTELVELLSEVAEGTDRVRSIARDLKAFAAPDHEGEAVLPLDDAIRSATKLVAKRIAPQATLTLELEAQGHVKANQNRLVQIFVNLLLNAADASSEGTQKVGRVRVTSRSEGADLVVEVADDGPGVPDGMKERIFEPFSTTKARSDGMGLGLYVTRNLVVALGGTISVGRAPEGGALFTVRLPEAPPAEPAPRPPAAPTKAAGRPRVLLVDDDPRVGRTLKLALEPDCEVDLCLDGRVALQRLVGGCRYDLIFCDLMMGEFGGADLHRELARLAPGVEKELVFMTGGVFEEGVSRFLSEVENPRIDKPFDVRAEVQTRLGAFRKDGA